MMRKAFLPSRTLLRKNGYSEKTIEEVYRWYGNVLLKENSPIIDQKTFLMYTSKY